MNRSRFLHRIIPRLRNPQIKDAIQHRLLCSFVTGMFSQGLPSPDNLKEHFSRYSVCKATREDVDWSGCLAREVFGGGDVVPDQVRLEWYQTNPGTYSIIKKGSQSVGYAIILPLKPDPLKRFIKGQLRERDIKGDDIYTPDEAIRVEAVYVASIVINKRPDGLGSKALVQLIRERNSILGKICDLKQLQVLYACAASNEGERLLKALDFIRIQLGSERSDQHDLL